MNSPKQVSHLTFLAEWRLGNIGSFQFFLHSALSASADCGLRTFRTLAARRVKQKPNNAMQLVLGAFYFGPRDSGEMSSESV